MRPRTTVWMMPQNCENALGSPPARDRYKIFILDEAHMVTQQGFNARLKIALKSRLNM